MSHDPDWVPTEAEIRAESAKIRAENEAEMAAAGSVGLHDAKHLGPRFSRFHGVRREGRRWRMTANLNRAARVASLHDTELQAALAYDKALVEHRLHTLSPNFPDAMPRDWLAAAEAARATPGVRREKIDRSAAEAMAAKGRDPKIRKPPAERRPIKATHGFRGIVKSGFRWRVQICLPGGATRKFGSYLDPESAARAYDRAVASLGLEGKRLNFPRETVS